MSRTAETWEKASFTVEAALVMVTVIGCLYAAVVFPIRLHDRVLERTAVSAAVCAAVADEIEAVGGAALETGHTDDEADRRIRRAQTAAEPFLAGRIFTGGGSLTVSVSAGRVKGSCADYTEEVSAGKAEDFLRTVTMIGEWVQRETAPSP